MLNILIHSLFFKMDESHLSMPTSQDLNHALNGHKKELMWYICTYAIYYLKVTRMY